MDIEELQEELNSNFKTRKVALKWFFGEIEFTRDEFLSLFDVADHVAEIVNKSFVERHVMYYDPFKEDPDHCITSLFEAAEFLDSKIAQLRGRLGKDNRGLVRMLEQLRSDLVLHAKKIRQFKKEIDFVNAGEHESEYVSRPSGWLPDQIRKLRLVVYPVFRSLIDLLPKDHPAKQRALENWYNGRALLDEAQKDDVLPRWRKETGA